MKPIAVYDGNTRKRLCYLQNAYGISYVKHATALWTAAFSLPYSDPKNKYCESMNLVEIWDVDGAGKDKYIGLFRIMPSKSEVGSGEDTITYNLEHVLVTLLDDTMIGWVEMGNTGVYTASVLNYILSRQSIKRWVLGVCDYRHQYLYGWQDENLLSATYSVTNAFIETDFRWEFDTKKYPWTLNLRRVSEAPVTDIRYKKNINGIEKNTDPLNLTTRLYCYGFGEGDNELTIKSVNGGIAYLDSPNISKYGVITRRWKDERFTNPQALLQSGKAMLVELENPIVSYDIDIATIRKAADLEAGDMVRVVDDNVDIYTRVVEVSKDDVSGQPLVGRVILANKNTDIAQSVADMTDRQRIATTYSQGAESIFAIPLYDNADVANPAELMFIIPENAIHVNEILLSARMAYFRAYSKATKGGGATTQTSNSGGGTTQSTSNGGDSTPTSLGGGDSVQSTSAGGNSSPTSSSGGGTSTSTSDGGGGYQVTDTYTMPGYNVQNSYANDENGQNHNHGLARGTGLVTDVRFEMSYQTVNGVRYGAVTNVWPLYTYVWTPSGAHGHGSHGHQLSIPSHRHSFTIGDHSHSVNIPSHQHSVNIPSHTHVVRIPSHQHSVTIPSHTHDTRLPDHTHDIEYGIYKGSRASGFTVAIDGITVVTYYGSVSKINLIAYMSKNANGEVLRGEHMIRITPNSLTRVECAIQIRLFTNAHGSGQY
jgi:phage minor structural protein